MGPPPWGAGAASEPLQRRHDPRGIVAHGAVTADQIAIAVGEHHTSAVQRARGVQIEEDGAAADEGLVVGAELPRVETPERREELPLAASPLEERTDRQLRIADCGLWICGFGLQIYEWVRA